MEIRTDKILIISNTDGLENRGVDTWSALTAPIEEIMIVTYWVLHKRELPKPEVLLADLHSQNINPASWLLDLVS